MPALPLPPESLTSAGLIDGIDFIGIPFAALDFDSFLCVFRNHERILREFHEFATTFIEAHVGIEVVWGRLTLGDIGDHFVAIEEIRMIGLKLPIPNSGFNDSLHYRTA